MGSKGKGKGRGQKRKRGGHNNNSYHSNKRRGPDASSFRGFLYTVEVPRNVDRGGNDVAAFFVDRLEEAPEIVSADNAENVEQVQETNSLEQQDEGADKTEDTNGFDIADELESELAELRNNNSKSGSKSFVSKDFSRPLFTVVEICKGVGFCIYRDAEKSSASSSNKSPSKMLSQGIEKAIDNKINISRAVCRMAPVDFSSKPHLEQFEVLLKEHLLKSVQNSQNEAAKGCSWRLVFSSRNMGTIKRNDCLKLINECLGSDYDVSSCDADVTILIEVCPMFAGFSVVSDWEQKKEYKIRELCFDACEAFC
eukprot:gene1130-666_t